MPMLRIRLFFINILSQILSIFTHHLGKLQTNKHFLQKRIEFNPQEAQKKGEEMLSKDFEIAKKLKNSTLKEKKVFGKEDIPELKYYKIIELLHNHYAHEEQRTGQIGPEVAKQLSSMSFKEVKELFDIITTIKMNHKDYIDGEIQEENEIADKEGVSLS